MMIRAKTIAIGLMAALWMLPTGPAQTPVDLWTLMGRDPVPNFDTLTGEIRLDVFTFEGPDASAAPIVTLSDISIQRPNRIHLAVISPTPDGDGILASDGEQLTLVSHILRQVARRPAPADISDIPARDLALVGEGGILLAGTLGMENPLLNRLATDGDAELRTLDAERRFGVICETVALETHSGGATERVTVGFRQTDGMPFWLEVTLASSDGTPRLRVTERWIEMQVDGDIPADTFHADTPEGFTAVPALDANLRRASESQ